MGAPTFTWEGNRCMQAVDDQDDLNTCFAYVLKDIIYADSVNRNKDGHGYIISKQDLINHLHLKFNPPNHPPNPKLFDRNGIAIPHAQGVGNTIQNAFRFAKKYGLLLEEDYRFEGKLKVVKFDQRPTDKDIVTLDGIGEVDDRRHYHIRSHLHVGPMTASLLIHRSFRRFVGNGIYMGKLRTEKKKDAEPHAVLIVGYGTHGKQRYYVVKNSHGVGWGNGGYGKVREQEFKDSVYFHYPINARLKLAPH